MSFNIDINQNPEIMKNISLLIFSITVILTISLNTTSQTVVKVSNALDFMNAIGSDKVIEMAPGEYNISQVMEQIDNPNISITDNFDGYQPDLSGLKNMTIKGSGKATVLLEPRYAWVMMFTSCENINLEGITFGHTEAGNCMGGVLGFETCNNVKILNCSLYGSGTVGIMTDFCNDFEITNSEIYECTYGLTYLYSSNNISFSKTKFRNTGQYNLVEIVSCQNVSFTKCSFTDNFTNKFMPHLFSIDENIWAGYAESEDEKSINVSLTKCTFKNNQISSFVNNDENLTLKGCKFSGNNFDQ